MSDVAQRIRDARAAGRALRVAGAGTWLGAGRPVAASDTLSLGDDRGIVEYVPGDLTLTARAGTPLSAIVAATRAHGQWLPLDPWGGDGGTIGATVSTATAGPHAHAMGLPRDTVLGLEFVTGTGETVRSGGRVVKNVAGFDLTRLLVGSWGTLGVITEVTVRLRACPDRTLTIAVPTDGARARLGELAATLRSLPFSPLACEVLNSALAKRLGFGESLHTLIQLGGNQRSVMAQRDLLQVLGDARDADDSVWRTLREVDHGAAGVWRVSQLPSLFGDAWAEAMRTTRGLVGAMVHGSPLRGVVRVVAPGAAASDGASLARAAAAAAGTVVIETLPAEGWTLVRPAPTDDRLSRAIRDKFDPAGVLNPGIMGEAFA